MTPTRCAVPASQPLASESGTQAIAATIAAVQTVRRLTSPDAIGLSPRATAWSLSASIASLLQPIDNWPVSTAAPTYTQPSGSRPAEAATTVTNVVTATVGPG